MKDSSHVEQIRKFIVEHIPKARQVGVQDEDDLIETGLLDSLGILDVVSYLEQEFDIAVDDDELTPDNFNSITNMSEYVQMKKNDASLSH